MNCDRNRAARHQFDLCILHIAQGPSNRYRHAMFADADPYARQAYGGILSWLPCLRISDFVILLSFSLQRRVVGNLRRRRAQIGGRCSTKQGECRKSGFGYGRFYCGRVEGLVDIVEPNATHLFRCERMKYCKWRNSHCGFEQCNISAHFDLVPSKLPQLTLLRYLTLGRAVSSPPWLPPYQAAATRVRAKFPRKYYHPACPTQPSILPDHGLLPNQRIAAACRP